MLIYGYGSSLYFYENDNKYYEFSPTYNNNGIMNVVVSLVLILNKVNDAYNIFDLGLYSSIRENWFKRYKNFGIKKLYL